MILSFFLRIIGKLLSKMPRFLLKLNAALIGAIVYHFFYKRRRLLLSNLYYGIPGKSSKWYQQTARITCSRTIEMGMLAVAAAFLSKKRILRDFTISPDSHKLAIELLNQPQPYLILIPHFCLCEATSFLPFILNKPSIKVGAMYRPLDNFVIDAYVEKARSRFGIKMLSRKRGVISAFNILKNKGIVSLLFDQHVSSNGYLTLFLDRVAASTPLPDYFVQKIEAAPYLLYIERTDFWKGTLHLLPLEVHGAQKGAVILAAQKWLEEKLRTSERLCQDWLWLHNRWKIHSEPHLQFNLNTRYNLLPESAKCYGYDQIPKKRIVFIRMPNWLGDVLMALPVIGALKKSRPDIQIVALVKPQFNELLKRVECIDKVITLPGSGISYFKQCLELRKLYPHVHVLFTNSFRGDLESWLIGAPCRFGIKRKGKLRPLLSNVWRLPNTLDESSVHQTHLWELFLKHFGLSEALELQPFKLPKSEQKTKKKTLIGLICGTENAPEKRWPITHWRAFIKEVLMQNPEACFYLFGTAKDRLITEQVAKGFAIGQVANLAGKTSLVEFADKLLECHVVVGNDTGGLHLANAIGVKTIGLYGPTNPVRTGLIFNAPKYRVQPPESLPKGGLSMELITPKVVFETLKEALEFAVQF
jgi:heptosyltransferase-2